MTMPIDHVDLNGIQFAVQVIPDVSINYFGVNSSGSIPNPSCKRLSTVPHQPPQKVTVR